MTTTENSVTEPTLFEINDGQRPVHVTGWLLAEVDSQKGHSVRWTELALYKTKSGRYVLSKIGRSDVFHDANCSQTNKGLRYDSIQAAGYENSTELAGHDQCRPGNNPRPVFIEQDIHSATIYSTAEEVSNALFRPGSDNVKFLSHLSRELFAQAASNDEGIAALLNTPIEVD